MAHDLILHPTLGDSGADRPVVLDRWLVHPPSLSVEPYRLLATRLRYLADSPGRVLGVTSAVEGEGKTSTSINLAVVLARDFGFRVMYMECDLRRPSVARSNRHVPGLVEFVQGELPIERVVRPGPVAGLDLMTAGRSESYQPVHILASATLQRSLVRLRERYQFVIVDCPPMMLASDIGLIAEWVDHFLLVIRSGETDRSVVQAAVEAVGTDRFVGAVLGDVGGTGSFSGSTYRSP